MDADGTVGHAVELDAELRLGVRPQIRNLTGMPDIRQNLQQTMRKIQRERHIVGRVAAGVAEHHTLVAGTLVHLVGAHDAAVDIGTLFVDGGDDPAGGGVEAVFGLGVSDTGDGFACYALDVDIGVARNLSANNHEAGCAKGLAGHFGLRILAQEFIEDGI